MLILDYETTRNTTYGQLLKLVRESGQDKIQIITHIESYNPAFGLVYLGIKYDDENNDAFGDNGDADLVDSVHGIWWHQMDHGKKKLTKENNLFIFTLETAGYGDQYGPNHSGLGIYKVKKADYRKPTKDKVVSNIQEEGDYLGSFFKIIAILISALVIIVILFVISH